MYYELDLSEKIIYIVNVDSNVRNLRLETKFSVYRLYYLLKRNMYNEACYYDFLILTLSILCTHAYRILD